MKTLRWLAIGCVADYGTAMSSRKWTLTTSSESPQTEVQRYMLTGSLASNLPPSPPTVLAPPLIQEPEEQAPICPVQQTMPRRLQLVHPIAVVCVRHRAASRQRLQALGRHDRVRERGEDRITLSEGNQQGRRRKMQRRFAQRLQARRKHNKLRLVQEQTPP